MNERRAQASFIGAIVLAIVVFILIVGFLSYHQVPEGHQGATKEWGAVTGDVLDPGAQFIIPIANSVQNVETRPRTYTMADDIGEGDREDADAVTVKTVNGSSVGVDITVRYRIADERADQFVVEWNDEGQMEQRLIRPTIRTQLRDEASSLHTTGPGSIYTQEGREALEQTAIGALRNEFEGQPIVLEAVQIRNIDLPDQIDSALDQKEQAKQRVEVERERVKQEEQRAEQKRVEAQANADVIRIEGQSLRDNPIILEQQAIQAMDEGTVYIVPEGQDSPPIILQKGTSGSDGSLDLGNETAGGLPASGD